ncbi:MAG: thiamine biosynthesis protein ThiS [Candidatus Hydrogenedentota bacterium]|nr:MAG: thiamine biosynthesis protein ThiS [Candidatus Hydrogenedentota bacterium]
MKISVNGEDRAYDDGLSIQGLLDEVGVSAEVTAVQHNGDIIPRDDLPNITLKKGDVLELVRIVGGG